MGFVHFVLTPFFVPRLPSPTSMLVATLTGSLKKKLCCLKFWGNYLSLSLPHHTRDPSSQNFFLLFFPNSKSLKFPIFLYLKSENNYLPQRPIQLKSIRLKSFVSPAHSHTFHSEQVFITVVAVFVVSGSKPTLSTSLHVIVIARFQVLFIVLLGI